MPQTTPASIGAAELTERLRERITTGEFVPNQRLVEADLAEEFSASRGNVRNALATLATEGLVERTPNRGARVRSVSIDEAVEITEVRSAVESLCARKAAQNASDDDIRELKEIRETMISAVDSGDRDEYSRGNSRLHSLLIKMSKQRTAAETIDRLHGQVVRHQFRLSQTPDRPTKSLPEHVAIIDAVVSRDPDAAAEAMRIHLESVADAIRNTAS